MCQIVALGTIPLTPLLSSFSCLRRVPWLPTTLEWRVGIRCTRNCRPDRRVNPRPVSSVPEALNTPAKDMQWYVATSLDTVLSASGWWSYSLRAPPPTTTTFGRRTDASNCAYRRGAVLALRLSSCARNVSPRLTWRPALWLCTLHSRAGVWRTRQLRCPL
jgi:hypothetical protein